MESDGQVGTEGVRLRDVGYNYAVGFADFIVLKS